MADSGMNEQTIEELEELEELEDIVAFDAAMAEDGPNIPWELAKAEPGLAGI